jgi:hypothetical protein
VPNYFTLCYRCGNDFFISDSLAYSTKHMISEGYAIVPVDILRWIHIGTFFATACVQRYWAIAEEA